MVQFNRSSKLSRPKSQCISLGSSPSSPFNDHCETQDEELLAKLPLEMLNLLALLLIPDIQRKSVYPLVRTEADRTQPSLNPLGMGCLSRAR